MFYFFKKNLKFQQKNVMKKDNHHLLDIMGEIGFEWRKNDENLTWRGKFCVLRSWKNEGLCFCFADITLKSHRNYKVR